jgi:hypothetical protein
MVSPKTADWISPVPILTPCMASVTAGFAGRKPSSPIAGLILLRPRAMSWFMKAYSQVKYSYPHV